MNVLHILIIKDFGRGLVVFDIFGDLHISTPNQEFFFLAFSESLNNMQQSELDAGLLMVTQ